MTTLLKCINVVGPYDTDKRAMVRKASSEANGTGEPKEPRKSATRNATEEAKTTEKARGPRETTIRKHIEPVEKEPNESTEINGSLATMDGRGQPLAAIAALILVCMHCRGQSFFL